MRPLPCLLAMQIAASVAFSGATAQTRPCDLSLVLAVDASASIDAQEYAIQTRGLANALRSPEVVSAILTGGGVLLSIFEWSGRKQQVLLIDWTTLDSEAAILAVAARLAMTKRQFDAFPTSIGPALAYASGLMGRAPAACLRKTVDVSGDGAHNDGFPPRLAYANFDFSGITVNGLVILGAWPDPLRYFYAEVIRGSGAFVVEARGFRDFEKAMRRKLVREIKGEVLTALPR